MNATTKYISGVLMIGCVIFATSPGISNFLNNPVSWELREQLVFLTGLWTMLFMVLAMVISIRSPWLNRVLKGLDKAYVLHKWVGIFALLFATLHWALEKIPHLLVEFEIIRNPGELTDASQYEQWQIALFQSGTLIAEFFIYVFVALVLIALLTKIPYSFFRKTHKIFPAIFLLLAWHAGTAQLKEHWLKTPAGYLLLIVLLVGSIAAIIALSQQIGKQRKFHGIIDKLSLHKNDVIDVLIRLDKPFNYFPGQFAFVRFKHSNEPHPFSIASSGIDQYTVRFVIKSLGDFTMSLRDHLNVDQPVTIEGPYGEFTFGDQCKRQVWIAGGIGITPFLGKLEDPDNEKSIQLWYCTRGELDRQFPGGIDVRHLNSTRKEYFSIDMINDLDDTSIWFCGPKDFGDYVKRDLKAIGFDLRHFHSDNFNMR